MVDALEYYDLRKRELSERLETAKAPRPKVDPAALRQEHEATSSTGAGCSGNVGHAQQALRRLVKGRLMFTPRGDHYQFSGIGTVKPLLGGRIPKIEGR